MLPKSLASQHDALCLGRSIGGPKYSMQHFPWDWITANVYRIASDLIRTCGFILYVAPIAIEMVSKSELSSQNLARQTVAIYRDRHG